MGRTTHVRICTDGNGNVETRSLDVVGEANPDGPHRLASIHVELPDDPDRSPAA